MSCEGFWSDDDSIFLVFAFPASDYSAILENEWEEYPVGREELTMMLGICHNRAILVSEEVFIESSEKPGMRIIARHEAIQGTVF